MIELLDGLYAGKANPDNSGGGSANKKKYGVTIDAMLGNLSSDAILQLPNVHDDVVLKGVVKIASQALMNKFYNTGVQSFSAPDLTRIDTASACENAFYNASVSSISLPKLKVIGGGRSMYRMFYGCPLTTVEFPEVTTVGGGYCCQGMFENCVQLTTLSFLKLNNLYGVTTQFTDMLKSCTDVTVHFPAAMETEMQDRADVQAGFGGTNTTVLFDL